MAGAFLVGTSNDRVVRSAFIVPENHRGLFVWTLKWMDDSHIGIFFWCVGGGGWPKKKHGSTQHAAFCHALGFFTNNFVASRIVRMELVVGGPKKIPVKAWTKPPIPQADSSQFLGGWILILICHATLEQDILQQLSLFFYAWTAHIYKFRWGNIYLSSPLPMNSICFLLVIPSFLLSFPSRPQPLPGYWARAPFINVVHCHHSCQRCLPGWNKIQTILHLTHVSSYFCKISKWSYTHRIHVWNNIFPCFFCFLW